MSSHHVCISLSGYWSEYNCGLMPHQSGVFCVYRARFDAAAPAAATMLELLHVGAAEDVNRCVHEAVDTGCWRTALAAREVLMFSCGPLDPIDLVRCQDALVRQHRPRLNPAPKGHYPHGYLAVTLRHHTPLLQRRFTVGQPPRGGAGLPGLGLLRRWGWSG
jgi:hypothetical protein